MPPTDPVDDLEIRRADAGDLPAMFEVLRLGLGWDVADPRFDRFFRWKHHDNPAGESPAWLAMDGPRIAGVRILLRWTFDDGGSTRHAVRAVDTATHPDYRGRGVFTRLTRGAIDALRADGVDFVFNTPNEQSRPGYLKMGWEIVGRLPVAARPRSTTAPVRMLRARGGPPADRWGAPATAGDPAPDVLADEADLVTLLGAERAGAAPGLTTARSAAFLRWRYGLDLLGYRALTHRRGLAEGVVLFRVRQRGPAREAVVCDVLAPGGERRAHDALLASSARQIDADYVVALGPPGLRTGFVPLPRQGPILTWRGLQGQTMPPRRAWHVGMGDIELF